MFSFHPRVSVSEGEFVIRLPELGLVAGGESYEDALGELIELVGAQAGDFLDRLDFYMQTDRRGQLAYLLKFALTAPDERRSLFSPAAAPSSFWQSFPELAELRVSPLAGEVPDALLRRLGPAPVQSGGRNLSDVLADLHAGSGLSICGGSTPPTSHPGSSTRGPMAGSTCQTWAPVTCRRSRWAPSSRSSGACFGPAGRFRSRWSTPNDCRASVLLGPASST